jgi:hypothetical protein
MVEFVGQTINEREIIFRCRTCSSIHYPKSGHELISPIELYSSMFRSVQWGLFESGIHFFLTSLNNQVEKPELKSNNNLKSNKK